MNLAPTRWKMVASDGLDPEAFTTPRMIPYGGEPMAVDPSERLRESVCENVNARYGTTETVKSGLALLPRRATEES